MSPSVPFTVNILTDNQSIEININKSPFATTLDRTAVRNAVLNCVKNTVKGYFRSVMVAGNDFPREVR
jgi:nitrogen fixation/metabolism regulation signal transduction histidine kinase